MFNENLGSGVDQPVAPATGNAEDLNKLADRIQLRGSKKTRTSSKTTKPLKDGNDVLPLDIEESDDDQARERDFTELDRIKDMAEFLKYEKHPSPAQLAREFGISRQSSREVFNQVMAYLAAEKAAAVKPQIEVIQPMDVDNTPPESVSTPEKVEYKDNGHTERYDAFKSAVESAQDLAQLEQAIKTMPGIVGSTDVFTQSELLQIMESIVKGKSPIHAMTRSGGLRYKLAELVKSNPVESSATPTPAKQSEHPNAQAIRDQLEKMQRNHGDIPIAVEKAEDKARKEALRESMQRDMSNTPKPAVDTIPSGTFDSKAPESQVPFEEKQSGFKKLWRFLSQDSGKRQTPEKKPEPLPAYEFKPHESAPLPNLEYLKSTVSLHERELIDKLKKVKNADDIYDVLTWNNGLYGYEFETAENRSLLVTDQTRKERMFTADEVANQIKNYVLGKNATLTFPNKYGLHEIAQAWKAKRDNVWFRRWGRAWKNRGEN